MYRRVIAVASVAIVAAALSVTVALTGCTNNNSSSRRSNTSSSGTTIPSGNVKLQSVKFDQLEKELEAKKGSVVVVDVWATW